VYDRNLTTDAPQEEILRMSMILALIGKRGPVSAELLRNLPKLAATALPLRHLPYRSQQWRSASRKVVLSVWDSEPAGGSARPLIHERDTIAIAKAGYVGHPAISDGFDLASIASSVTIDAETVSHLGGAFALFVADGARDRVTVWNTVTRLVGVFHAETDDLVILGTRALLVSLVLAGRTQPVYAPERLVPFFSCGYHASEHTPYRGVDVLAANTHLTATPSGLGIEPIDDFDGECGTVVPTVDDYDRLADRFVEAVGRFGGARIACTLTGGKDSRLVAAALHAAGANFRTYTRGFPDHPDVVVAGRVAQALGVPHTHSVPPTKEREGVRTMSVDVAARARETLFATDGMLSAYENVQPPERVSSSSIAMGGAGGESLRGGFAKAVSETGDISWKRARQYLYGRVLGQCDVLDPVAVVAYEALLNGWIERQETSAVRPAVALDTFYLYYRTGRWKAAARASRHGARDVEPLTDNLITRDALRIHERVKLNDRLVYEVLKRLAPSLIDIPFADKRWLFEKEGPAPGQEDEWDRRAPVLSSVGTPSSFNWRTTVTTDLYDAFYDQIFNDRRASALFEVVDSKRLRALMVKQRGHGVPGGRVALYWALYTASVLLSNAWLEPEGESRPVWITFPAQPAT
jgi:asparagine synthetase B (glutamine-hydrolysing)